MSVTLLLADDSATIQRVIEMTFADEDVRVVTVGDGREAIERIAADPPDIVLADTNMPETDGYDVSAFVKADGALSHIPVVLLTGAFDPVDDARAREAGCDAVLVKPFEPTAVVGRVRELLGAPASAGGAPPDGAAAVPIPASEAAVGDGAPGAAEDAGPSKSAAAESAAPEASPDAVESASAVPGASAGAVESAAPEVAPDAAEPAAPDALPTASEAAESPSPPTWVGEAPAAPPPAVPAVEGPAPPTLADAFAALLAAEQGDVARARAAYPWPRQAADDDELVERVAQRVVERLSEEVTGELVSEVVARVAERLVRDQIGRIEPV